ncbi:MAG: glycosyltransferase family 4 protein [Azospirillaceae bacterium]
MSEGPPGYLLLAHAATAVALAAALLTRAALAIARRRAYLAHPDDRSSHDAPTPYGGGWGVMLALLPALAILAATAGTGPPPAVLAGAVALMAISWLDDRRPLGPLPRLGVQAAAVAVGLALLPGDAAVFQGWLPLWADRAVTALGWLWFVNLFNFMDGIDGLAGTETASLGLGVAAALAASGAVGPAALAPGLLMAGAAAGFLIWNWHRARIFLGDVGSVPLGYLAGFLLIALAIEGHLAAAVILPAYYLADATVTLARRVLRGEKVWRPHREHFYQRAARALGRHDAVVLRIAALNGALVALAVAATLAPSPGLATLAVAVAYALTAGVLVSSSRLAAGSAG